MSRSLISCSPGQPASLSGPCKPLFTNQIRFGTITVFTVSALSSSPILFVFVFLYLAVSFRLQRYYMKLLREVQRLKSMSSSPVIQIFKECLEGVSTIRYFGGEMSLLNNYCNAIDTYQSNSICWIGCRKWFQLRVAVMSLMVVIPCILFSVSFCLINLSCSPIHRSESSP